jgi:histidine ammonia-lyase
MAKRKRVEGGAAKSAGVKSARPVVLGPDLALTPSAVAGVARAGLPVRLGPGAGPSMRASRRVVEACLDDGQAHYGINTGFGSLAKKRIDLADLATLQRNLVRSHAAGVGEPMGVDVTRAMMLCLAASLARGLSGVRPVVVELLVGMLNANVTPVVPSLGSVGASGDLAPLAHVALAMIGEGQLRDRSGRVMSSSRALREAGLTPIELAAKEGLALINGTHLMAGRGALLVEDAHRLLGAASVALAMSIDACRATSAFLDPRLYLARRHAVAGAVAASVQNHLLGSQILTSHVENDPRVQDPYSLRAAPTVLGAVAALVLDVENAIGLELGAVTDNPLVIPDARHLPSPLSAGLDGHVSMTGVPPHSLDVFMSGMVSQGSAILSGANFHGMPVAIPLDCLAIGLAHMAGISERRSYLMTGAFEPESHLKPFLAPRPGLQSGLMIAQYTAAACVNELVGLATPASVANVPTCAGVEDYNSFGPRGASKAARGVELATSVVAIEMLIAAAGLDLHRPLRSGAGVERAHALIRSKVAPMGEDRPLSGDIAAIAGLIDAGAFGSL